MTDWERDPAPFGDCLKRWAKAHAWTRQQAANELRVTIGAYNRWCDQSRESPLEGALRRLMTMIDRAP